MERAATSFKTPLRGSYRVRRPRASDAIGESLRGAFDCDRLPEDMRAMLRKLGSID